mgnify:CR=1 FL=1
MKTKEGSIECNRRTFVYEEFIFSYESDTDDKILLDNFIAVGNQLAKAVNPTLARDASRRRKYHTVLCNCVAGVIAEYCWRYRLKLQAERSNAKISVESRIFQSVDKHVDISIAYANGSSRTVEVRSSFPYTGLTNAVCRVFDIIGWYVNPVKTKEIRKDYYVRTLFPFHSEKLWERLKGKYFSAFLTGGATRKLLEESPFSRDKEFIPYDDIDSMLSSQRGTYRVIEPIINAYDTAKITQHILKGIG